MHPIRHLRVDDLTSFSSFGAVALNGDATSIAWQAKVADLEGDGWRQEVRLGDVASARPTGRLLAPHGRLIGWDDAFRRLAYLRVERSSGRQVLSILEQDGRIVDLLVDLHDIRSAEWSVKVPHELLIVARPGRRPVEQGVTPPGRVLRSTTDKPISGRTSSPTPFAVLLVDTNSGRVTQLTDRRYDVSHAISGRSDDEVAFIARGEDCSPGTRAVYVLSRTDGTVSRLDDGSWAGQAQVLIQRADCLYMVGQAQAGPCQLGSVFRWDDGRAIDLLPGLDRRVIPSSRPGMGGVSFLTDESFVFLAQERGATWLFRSDLDGDARPVLDDPGVVVSGFSASADPGQLAIVKSDRVSAEELFLLQHDAVRPITRTNRDIQEQVRVFPAEDIEFLSTATRVLHGYLIDGRPCAQEPGPLLVEIHGGPDRAWRPAFSPYFLYRQELAAAGWSILLLNPRGSDGYGLDHMRAPAGRFGFVEEDDFVTAVSALVEQGIADPARMAVTGSSHGGFMTNWLTARTDLFAAAVSVNGIANWFSIFGTAGDITGFMVDQFGGTPQQVPQRYLESSPLSYADRVTAPTLLIHGEDDSEAPLGQSDEWFTSLQHHLCPSEMVVYSGADHLFMFNGPLSRQLDYGRRIVDWLTLRVPTTSALKESKR